MGASVQPVPTGGQPTAFEAALAAAKQGKVSTGPTVFDQALASAKSAAQPDPSLAPGGWGTAQKIAETITSGLPFASTAVAGGRGLLDLLHGEGLDAAAKDIEDSKASQQEHVASLPWYERIPLQMVGGSALAGGLTAGAGEQAVARVLPKVGMKTGGAIFGALAGADQPASSLSDRAVHAAIGAPVGIAGTILGSVAGKAAANVAERIGLADAVAKIVQPISPDLSASMGTEGQVNEALGLRDQQLNAIQAPAATPGAQQLAREAAIQQKANELYTIAKADTRPLQDPVLNQQLSDPQIQKGLQMVSANRTAAGTPLPRVSVISQLPPELSGTIAGENWARLMTPDKLAARGITNSGVDLLAKLPGGQPTGVEVPDPQALNDLKRYLYTAAQSGQESSSPFKQDEAAALLPKVAAIRDRLHALSPAWAEANTFYAGAKGADEAFQDGFDAFKTAANVRGETLTTNSPEALLQQVSEPRYPSEPTAQIAVRKDAFQQGMRSAAAAQVQDAAVTRGIPKLLNVPALEPTGPGTQLRSMMFNSPEDAAHLEQTTANLRGAAMAQPSGGGSSYPPVSKFSALRYLIRKLGSSPDLLATPQGQATLMQRLADPVALQQGIAASQRGSAAASPFLQALGIDVGGQLAR
jgi:hypothetical protein